MSNFLSAPSWRAFIPVGSAAHLPALRHSEMIMFAVITAVVLAVIAVWVLDRIFGCDRWTRVTIILAAVIGALILEGCAPVAQTPSLPAPVVAQAPKPKPRHVMTPDEILAAQPPEVQRIIQQHEPGARWPTVRRGNTVLYPYDSHVTPLVDCAALRTTDIQLEAGETITAVALGDSARWTPMEASSGNAIPHLTLKPEISGIQTNLTIYTTKRIYHYNVRSSGRPMDEVESYYPDEVLQQIALARQAAQRPASADDAEDATSSALPEVDPSHLNFAYKIDGAHVAWIPSRVFDDGSRVYLEMPPAMQHGPAPALLIDGNGGEQMVNYRVVPNGTGGDYYVVDRLFDRAELLSGVGREQDKVLVTYSGNSR
jgi:type IV secretion system protein TrbG